MSYTFDKIVNSSFTETIDNVIIALQKEGFGVLTEIDVKSTLKKKIDVDFRNYKILGACNPPFAYKVLSEEDKIGAMLPCNVVIQEHTNGKIEVSIINPMVAMQSVGNSKLEPIAAEITQKLCRVLENI